MVLKVSGGSNTKSLAGALVKYREEGAKVSLLAIGAGAVNQMVKALCIARGMSAQAGIDLWFTCGFQLEKIRGERKTAIKIYVRER